MGNIIRGFFNKELEVGDKVKVVDGSSLTCLNSDVKYYIIYAYEHETGSPYKLEDMIGEVISLNNDSIFSEYNYFQDAVVKFGNKEFRTSSGMLRLKKKAIKWNIPQLFISKPSNLIVLSSGNNNETAFEATVVESGNQSMSVGTISKVFSKDSFEPYDENVILTNK